MHNLSEILVWGSFNFEKMPKTGFWNVWDVYSISLNNQTKGDTDLKFSLKLSLGCPLSDSGGQYAQSFQNFGLGCL